MKRYKIIHQTQYAFSGLVQLQPHTLRLRPREGHELRIESSALQIDPKATLRWRRDVEGNSVASASFTGDTDHLNINSEIVIQQYDQAPLDFVVADYAVDYPFRYLPEDQISLTPYMSMLPAGSPQPLLDWLACLWQPTEKIQTFTLLMRLNTAIFEGFSYQRREEEGVQSAEQTIGMNAGSCRDFACLFMAACQELGLAARFVSGYLHSPGAETQAGSTHAWAEVFIPGAGWKGFDPTNGTIVGAEHIAVAVARLPESIPPIAGSFLGAPGATMSVKVWVNELS